MWTLLFLIAFVCIVVAAFAAWVSACFESAVDRGIVKVLFVLFIAAAYFAYRAFW